MPPRAKKETTAKKNDKTIEGYVAGFDGWQAQVVQSLVSLIQQAAPNATSGIKWGQPVFEEGGPFAYVKAFSKHVNLGLWRGADLLELDDRLRSGGKKMAHIKITGPEQVDTEGFTALIVAAVELNHTLGNPTQRG